MMRITVASALFFTVVVQNCGSECQNGFTPKFYLATNRVLQNQTFQRSTGPSPISCARECSMNPQCGSFNYHESTRTCELNKATRVQAPDCDFPELQGSAYYDDNFGTPVLSVPDRYYNSCEALLLAGYSDSGIYTIYPSGVTGGFLQVYCDMVTDGGGWIVFQRRQDGSVDFFRNWTEYQFSFGDLVGEFWLGNDHLRALTESGEWELRVDMGDWENNTAWASYGQFGISGQLYNLTLGLFNEESTAGGRNMVSLSGFPFSTRDANNNDVPYSCAKVAGGAWWFNDFCTSWHLNGKYFHKERMHNRNGIEWGDWKGLEYSLRSCSMKIKSSS